MVGGGTDDGQGGPEEHWGQNLLTITGREAEGRGEKGGGGALSEKRNQLQQQNPDS